MNPATTPDPKTPKGSELRNVSIRKAENGYVASCSYIKTEKNKKDMCCSWEPDKEYVLTDRDSIIKFVDEVLGLTPTAPKTVRRFGNAV